jgi:hypothetical protein
MTTGSSFISVSKNVTQCEGETESDPVPGAQVFSTAVKSESVSLLDLAIIDVASSASHIQRSPTTKTNGAFNPRNSDLTASYGVILVTASVY